MNEAPKETETKQKTILTSRKKVASLRILFQFLKGSTEVEGPSFSPLLNTAKWKLYCLI